MYTSSAHRQQLTKLLCVLACVAFPSDSGAPEGSWFFYGSPLQIEEINRMHKELDAGSTRVAQ
jgi:hypothetical protein